MENFSYKFLLIFIFLLGSTLSSLAEGDSVSSTLAVPEPSVSMLAGLCGIIFLLWRKK